MGGHRALAGEIDLSCGCCSLGSGETPNSVAAEGVSAPSVLVRESRFALQSRSIFIDFESTAALL
jgi:hypothetical protein